MFSTFYGLYFLVIKRSCVQSVAFILNSVPRQCMRHFMLVSPKQCYAISTNKSLKRVSNLCNSQNQSESYSLITFSLVFLLLKWQKLEEKKDIHVKFQYWMQKSTKSYSQELTQLFASLAETKSVLLQKLPPITRLSQLILMF